MSTRGVGVKGAAVYTTTGDPRVDLNMKLVRGAEVADLLTGLDAVLVAGHLEDAFVMTAHARNVRGGKGERDVSLVLLRHLWAACPEVAELFLELWPRYGCWRDLFRVAEEKGAPMTFRNAVVRLARDQLLSDREVPEGQSISLCAKWAPRERSGSGNKDKYPGFLRALVLALFPDDVAPMRSYRQLVAGLNRRLGTLETLMSAGSWDEIRPGAIPGRAGKLYGRALLNLVSTKDLKRITEAGALRCPEDAARMACRERFLAHLEAVAAGRARMNGGATVFPHEIVKKAWDGWDTLTVEERTQLSALWRTIVTETAAGGGLGRSIMMCDFSGSMLTTGQGGGSMQSAGKAKDLPYWVSMALGILGSQVAGGAFRGRMMTFESAPAWHRYPVGVDGGPADLFDCLLTLRAHMPVGYSTNFEAAMNLVLRTLEEEGVTPGEELENIIVLTDMGWDAAAGEEAGRWETLLERFQRAFRGRGYTAPRIVIWNLSSQFASDHHATATTPGVALLSGWSAAQFKVLQKEGPRSLTPLEVLRLELDDPIYDPVRAAVAAAVATTTGLLTPSGGAGSE